MVEKKGIRYFKTRAVLGAYTGICPEGGFSQVHDVLDHLFPGIMTIGCAAVVKSGVAIDEINLRVEGIRPYVLSHGMPGENWMEWFAAAEDELGQEIALSGPSENQAELSERAFKQFMLGVDNG